MTNTTTFHVPAGAIKLPAVKPLTQEQLQKVIAMRKARKAEQAPAAAEALNALAEKFAPMHKVRNVTPSSVKSNNGFSKENLGTVDWSAQDRKGKVASKNRLSAKAARSKSKK